MIVLHDLEFTQLPPRAAKLATLGAGKEAYVVLLQVIKWKIQFAIAE